MKVPDLGDSPILVWISIIGTALLFLAQLFPQVVEKVFKGWQGVVEGARRTSVAKDDADIADMNRQIKNLAQRVNDLSRDQQARDECAALHQQWDALVRNEAANVGLDLPPPPPLIPYRGSCPEAEIKKTEETA